MRVKDLGLRVCKIGFGVWGDLLQRLAVLERDHGATLVYCGRRHERHLVAQQVPVHLSYSTGAQSSHMLYSERRVQGAGFRNGGFRRKIQGLGFRVQGSGSRV